jgi:hypothetical protein
MAAAGPLADPNGEGDLDVNGEGELGAVAEGGAGGGEAELGRGDGEDDWA